MKLKDLLLQYFTGKEKYVDPKIKATTYQFLTDIRSVKVNDLNDTIDKYDEDIIRVSYPMCSFSVFNIPEPNGNFRDHSNKIVELLKHCDLFVRPDQGKCVISHTINTTEQDDLCNYLNIQDVINLDGELELCIEYNGVIYDIKDFDIDFGEFTHRPPQDDDLYRIYIHAYISVPVFNNSDDWDPIGWV